MGTGTTGNEFVKGRMIMHEYGDTLYDSGEYVKGLSGIRIKVRGNSSASISNKSFKIKLQAEEDLLGREDPKHKNKEWALLNYFSTCDLRTVTGLYVGKLLGMPWEPEWQFVNLFVNDRYRGLYLLSETVEVSEGRCQVGPDGFLFEADPYWWNEDQEKAVVKTKRLPYAMGYTFKYPKYKAGDAVLDDIKSYMDEFEDALYDGRDISPYIDLKSFARWMLAHDILGTKDGAGSNLFVMKDDFPEGEDRYDSKLCMGPLWDLGTIFSTPDEWATAHYMTFFYYEQLFKRPEFVEEYLRQWVKVREEVGPKTIAFVEHLVEEQGEAINYSRKISPRDRGYRLYDVQDDVDMTKKWFSTRKGWLDHALARHIKTAVGEIRSASDLTSVSIYDVTGRLRGRLEGDEGAALYRGNGADRLSGDLPAGVYILRATYSDGKSESRKVVLP